MIEARALVVRAGEGKVWARLTERQGGCGRCDEPGGCHAPRLAEMFKSEEQVFVIDDPLGLSVGERVKIVIEDGAPLRAAWASYGLGTALVLAGAGVGVWLAPPEWGDLAAGLGALAGVLVMAFVLRRRARRAPAGWRLRVERDDGTAAGCMGQGA